MRTTIQCFSFLVVPQFKRARFSKVLRTTIHCFSFLVVPQFKRARISKVLIPLLNALQLTRWIILFRHNISPREEYWNISCSKTQNHDSNRLCSTSYDYYSIILYAKILFSLAWLVQYQVNENFLRKPNYDRLRDFPPKIHLGTYLWVHYNTTMR